MNKRQIIIDMKAAAGSGFVTRSWLAQYLQLRDAHSVDKYLVGLPSVSKRYFVDDVAERIMQFCEYKGG